MWFFPGFSGFRPSLMNDRLDIREIFLKGRKAQIKQKLDFEKKKKKKKKKKNAFDSLEWNFIENTLHFFGLWESLYVGLILSIMTLQVIFHIMVT